MNLKLISYSLYPLVFDLAPIRVKVRSFLEDSCAILISFKIVVVFNTTSANIKTKSADAVLKTTTILKEMRIPQRSS